MIKVEVYPLCVLNNIIWPPHPLPLVVIGGAPPLPWDTPLFGWLITVPPPLFGKGDSSRPPTPFWKGWLITFPPPLDSPPPCCMLQTGTPPPLGSTGGPPPPEKDDSSWDDEWASWRQVLYFDWVVQNINERLCIMATYFIFRVIGLMTHPRMMNERNVLRLGTSMCMMGEHHCHIIWNELYFQYNFQYSFSIVSV